ncbi:glycerol kinase 5 isoform X2 [Rhynchophorus ferrugineus]|uniref:glycerol kinase 5 isoform X2 n=1 Tax=Rhynchophorus ferrugineus TaxID=354439 RepID=UPI003FCDA66D
MMSRDSYVAALDIGTTTLRCQIIDRNGECVGSAFDKVKLHYPEVNSVEIDPNELWESIITIMKNSLIDANISAKQIKSVGISTQRATFITWSRKTGKPFHNFITWKDLRAWDYINKINRSWKTWFLRTGSFLVHLFTRQLKFNIVANLKFTSAHMSDQSASMYGSCSFKEDDLKITMGTGVFLNLNTAQCIRGGIHGTYPLVSWRVNNGLTYMTEASGSDCGSLVEWMLATGLISNPKELNIMPNTIRNSSGVYFIPAFSGLSPPISNENAATGFIGIKPDTKKEHMIRAVLESIVFKTVLVYDLLTSQCPSKFSCIKVDGGVSRNNFICQLLADLIQLPVKRLSAEMAALGVAFVAGLSSGFWKDKGEILEIDKTEVVFQPNDDLDRRKELLFELEQWQKATDRFKSWYQ